MELIKNQYPHYSFRPAIGEKKGTIVFLHGFAVTSEYHNEFANYAKNYDYYAIEHAGHGITPLKDKKQLSPKSYADDCAKLIEQLDLNDIILIGHSMGGGISMILYHLIPDRIKKLVLVTPMNSKGTVSIKNIYNFFFNFVPKNMKRCANMYKILLKDFSVITDTTDGKKIMEEVLDSNIKNKKAFTKLKHKLASLSNLSALKKAEKDIDVPTLLIVGKYDGCINPNTTKKSLAKKNKNIEVKLFENSAHLPFFEEKDLYCDIVLKFIEG